MVIYDREYRTAEEAEHRQRELLREWPLPANPGSWSSVRKTDSGARAVDEYCSVRDYIDQEGPRQRSRMRSLERRARDPHSTESEPAWRAERGGSHRTAELRARRDEALRTIERHADHVSGEAGDRLYDLVSYGDPRGLGARYLTAVGDPDYSWAFGKIVMDLATAHLRMTREKQEAVRRVAEVERERAYFERGQSLTGAQGGFAVPFELDPSILLTSGGVVNPIRRLARVIPIAVDEWRGSLLGEWRGGR